MDNLIKKQIRDYAIIDYPMETCGLIVAKNDETKVIPCKNTSVEKEHFFSIDANDYLKASLQGKIIACYHTHLKRKTFSEYDKLQAENHKIKYIMYCHEAGEFFEYVPSGQYNKYVGLDFEIGKQDCFTLLRMYYKEELRIEINDYKRYEGWYNDFPDIFAEKAENEGFLCIMDEPKLHDVILVSYYGHPTHVLIYLGDNQILHHPRNKKSTIDIYSDSYKRRAFGIYRHKTLE